MNKKRMNDLIKVLEGVARSKKKRQHFNMDTWFSNERGVCIPPSLNALTDCGTTGCAVGWYKATHPQRLRNFKPEQWWEEACASITQHFGITKDTATYLFYPAEYPDGADVRTVLARIKQFVKEYPNVQTGNQRNDEAND